MGFSAFGKKTMEAEILKGEAEPNLNVAAPKKRPLRMLSWSAEGLR